MWHATCLVLCPAWLPLRYTHAEGVKPSSWHLLLLIVCCLLWRAFWHCLFLLSCGCTVAVRRQAPSTCLRSWAARELCLRRTGGRRLGRVIGAAIRRRPRLSGALRYEGGRARGARGGAVLQRRA